MSDKRRLVIFGAGQIAELAWFYFTHDSVYEVVGFTVDRPYIASDTFLNLPVIPFDEAAKRYPAKDHDMFVAISYAKLNALRASKCDEAKAAGFRLASYVSSRATTFPGFSPGENAFILEDNTIQPFAKVGRNVTLWSGNHIGHHSTIGDHCFISSHVVVSGGVNIGDYSFVGVNSTIRDHVNIGERCVIGAGSLIVDNAEPLGVYSAPPAERSRVPANRLRNI